MARARKQPEEDHIDRFLAELGDSLAIDLETEGIVDRIGGLHRRFLRLMEETLTGFELTHGEFSVLGQLHRSDGATPGQLAKRQELSSGAMTNRLDRLEEAGLIERVPDAEDRRSVLVRLTKEGADLYRRAVGVQGEKEALVASALNAREKKELNALLRRLMLVFERQDPDRKW